MPPKGKGKKVGTTVFKTPTYIGKTTQGRTIRKARLRRNIREWPFFVFT
jgi:hypothetical protein